jgi:hypothetical protein
MNTLIYFLAVDFNYTIAAEHQYISGIPVHPCPIEKI